MKKNDVECREPYEAPRGYEFLNRLPLAIKIPVRHLLWPYAAVFMVGFILGVIW